MLCGGGCKSVSKKKVYRFFLARVMMSSLLEEKGFKKKGRN